MPFYLTFAEAIEALKSGKKVRCEAWVRVDRDQGVILHKGEIVWDTPNKTCRQPLGFEETQAHWHIVDDKPPKSRAQKMAEKFVETPESRGLLVEVIERYGREVIEAVAAFVAQDPAHGPQIWANDIRREFLEPHGK